MQESPRRPVVTHSGRMHLVNRRRFRSGSAGRTTVPRATRLALVEYSTRGAASGTESLVLDSARTDAQKAVDRAAGRAARLARRATALAARAARLRACAAAHVDRVAMGPAGAEEASLVRERHDRDAACLDRSLAAGETLHRRPSRAARVVAFLVPWLDAALFAYVIAGISNASIAQPWTTPVPSLVTLAFTAFVVLTVASFTPWLGHRLRGHKGPDGEPVWAEVGGVLLGFLALWVVLTTAVAVTMFVRVLAESALAGAAAWLGVVVAVLLSIASIVLSGFVLVAAYADGTELADDVRRRGRTLARGERVAARLRARADRLDVRRARLAVHGELLGVRATVRADELLARGERRLELVRLRAGTPTAAPRQGPVTPDRLDRREHRFATETTRRPLL